MNYYLLQPEVPGGVSDYTRYSSETYPNGARKVLFLHIDMDGWLGGDLLENTPCFFITERLLHAFQENEMTGYTIEEMMITKSELFEELQPDDTLPAFIRLIPTEFVHEGLLTNDFYFSKNNSLVVSETCLRVLQQFNLSICEIELLQRGENE